MLQKYSLKLKQIDKQLPDYIGLLKLLDFAARNTRLIIFLSLSGLIAYGYDFFSFALKIDSENHAFYYGPQLAWISQGRWGTYLLSYLLLADPVMPFIPTLIAIAGCVLGALFFVHALTEKRGLADYLAGPVAIACPLIYFAMYFTTLGYGVGVAFAVSSIGVYLLRQPTWFTAVLAMLCFTFGIGIYQAVLPLIASLFCLQLVALILETDKLNFATLSRRVLIFFTIIACAFGFSQVISTLALRLTHVAFNTSYISQFIQFETNASYLKNALYKTTKAAWSYYTGDKQFYLFDLRILKILFLLTLTVSMYRIFTARSGIWVRLTGIALLAAAIIAPVTMLVLNAGEMPPRTVLGISYVIAGLVFFTMSASSNLLRLITGVLVVCCFYNFSVINNRYAFSSQMTWLADREFSVQLLDKIHDASNKLPVKTDPFAQLPIEIVGWLEYPESPIFVHREVIGASFYTWGAGDAERVTRLFNTMGVSDYRPATKLEKLSVVETAKQMPFWPYNGSVDVINGVIVVKLRDYNPHQLIGMCEPPHDMHPICLKYIPK